MKNYLANVPGFCGPISCHGFNEKEARAHLRRRLCIRRLAKGTKLYEQEDRK